MIVNAMAVVFPLEKGDSLKGITSDLLANIIPATDYSTN